jgi:hypothetical protein
MTGRYAVRWPYFARRDGRSFGPWAAGEAVELSHDDAEWVERDSPGVLTPKGSAKVAPAREAETPANRQHRGGRTR